MIVKDVIAKVKISKLKVTFVVTVLLLNVYLLLIPIGKERILISKEKGFMTILGYTTLQMNFIMLT